MRADISCKMMQIGHCKAPLILHVASQRLALEEALRQLYIIECLDADGAIQPLGHRLARLPLDPSLGRALVAAAETGCLEDALSLSAMLTCESVFSGHR